MCVKYMHTDTCGCREEKKLSCLTNDKKGNRANGFFSPHFFECTRDAEKMAIRISNEMLNTSHNQCSTDIYIALCVRRYVHRTQNTKDV